MEATDSSLSFLQKNMLAALQHSGGKMRHRDLCLQLHYTQYLHSEWYAARDKLIQENVIRVFQEPSTKRRNTQVQMVEIVEANLPPYRVLSQAVLKREEEEKAWAEDGWDSFIDGFTRKQWPKDQKKYSTRWYRQKAVWQQAYDEAEAFQRRTQGKPEKHTRVIISRF